MLTPTNLILVVWSLVLSNVANGFSPISTHGHAKTTRLSQLQMTANGISRTDGESQKNIIRSRRAFLSLISSTAATAAGVFSVSNQPAIAAAGSSSSSSSVGGKVRYGDESLMSPKNHGTTTEPVQDDLMYGVSRKLADKICSYNRHFAEFSGYFRDTNFEDVVRSAGGPVTFYDSVTGKPLFKAPINRSVDEFLTESEIHGWPSFRDDEVVWNNVRVLRNSGETVSTDGTHLGHNLPDRAGNRYCINLVSIAGKPASSS